MSHSPADPILPSDKSFGFTFVVVFAAWVAIGWWKAWPALALPAVLGALTLVTTLARPSLLRPLNRQWMKLAELLNRIVSPVVLGIIFFGLITPTALVMRWAGRDALARRFDPKARSYWIDRSPPGPDPKTLNNQF